MGLNQADQSPNQNEHAEPQIGQEEDPSEVGFTQPFADFGSQFHADQGWHDGKQE